MPAPDAVLAALAAATGGHADPAGPGDAVAGVPARWVAAPGSAEEAAGVLRVAAEHGLAVVARGGGSKLDWGVPPRSADVLVDTRRLDRIVEHAAGDLVAVVQAGVRLADLAESVGPAGQQLAVDDPVAPPAPGSTVGGAVATGVGGPRRVLYGGVRDLILGVTLVRADGVVAKAGGKVVKNVAGYDLAKLVCGSFGTLGLVVEAAFRLHPVPPARAFVSVRAADAGAAQAAVQRVLHAQLVPAAVEVDRPAGEAPATVTVLLEGLPPGVAGRAEQAVALLGPGAAAAPDPPAGWGRHPAEAGGTLVKLTAEIAGLARLLAAVTRAAGDAGLPVALRGSAGVGVFHAGIAAAAEPAAVAAVVGALRRAAPGFGGSAVVLTAPAPVRAAVDQWGPVVGLDLMRRVKNQFDPESRLAPGRFVGGI